MGVVEVAVAVVAAVVLVAAWFVAALVLTVLTYRCDGIDLWRAVKANRGRGFGDKKERRVRRPGRFAFRERDASYSAPAGGEPVDVGEATQDSSGGARDGQDGV